MNGWTTDPSTLIQAYMSLIWWINSIAGALIALNWIGRRHGEALQQWLSKRLDAAKHPAAAPVVRTAKSTRRDR